jgi:hypothetical protein
VPTFVDKGSETALVPELLGAWGYNWATQPEGDINSGHWPSRIVVGLKASDLTLENTYCYEISDKNCRMDLSKTTFTTSKDYENGPQYSNLECPIYTPGRKD